MSKKSGPFIYSEYTIKIGQDLLDFQYQVQGCAKYMYSLFNLYNFKQQQIPTG